MAVSFQNAARIARNSGDEEGVDGDVDEQQQPPVYRPCDPHADGRPHRLQWGRPRQERARRPCRFREHASDSFAFRGGSSDGSPKRLCSPENGSTEAEDDGGDDEAHADHATASKEMIMVMVMMVETMKHMQLMQHLRRQAVNEQN